MNETSSGTWNQIWNRGQTQPRGLDYGSQRFGPELLTFPVSGPIDNDGSNPDNFWRRKVK